MSRPQISTGLQQARSGYPPSAPTLQSALQSPQQSPQRSPHQSPLQRQNETTITLRTHQPGTASASSQHAWLATRRAHDDEGLDAYARDAETCGDEGDDDEGYDDDNASAQQAWRRALGAAGAIQAQLRDLCAEDVVNIADLATVFRALKAARASSQLQLLQRGGEDKVCPALGSGVLRLVVKLSQALGGSLDVCNVDIGTISVICDGLRAALGKSHSESLFTTAQLGRLKAPLRMIVDTLMQRALDCGLPNDQKSNQELLSILKLLSRGLKLRFADADGQSDTLLNKASQPIGDVFWQSLLVIRDWPANPDEKGGNLSSVGMLDTRQLGIVMVQLNTMHKQLQRDLDEKAEDGLTGRQLLGQCALKLCGGNALDEFRLWSRPDASSTLERTSPMLARAPLSAVVVANISNTIKDFFEAGIIPATGPALAAIHTRLVRWMKVSLQNGDAEPGSQSFSNFANFLRCLAEPGLRGQALPVEDVAAYDEVCGLVLEGCAGLVRMDAPDEGDIQHLSNLASFGKAMARRNQLPGHLYRKAAGSVVRAMAGHGDRVRQPESFSSLLAACVFYMQSGVLAVQSVQPLVDALLKQCTTAIKPYWPAPLRKQLLQAAVAWLADPRVALFGDASDVNVLSVCDAIFKCRKPGDEPLAYLKALDLIAKRHPAQLANYLPLLSALTGRSLALVDAPAAIAQAILGHMDEPPVVEIAVEEPPPVLSAPLQAAAPAAEPVRPGSANWQPIGGVLAKPVAQSGSGSNGSNGSNGSDEGNEGKTEGARKPKRKKHRPARSDRLPRSEPVATVRSYAPAGSEVTTRTTTNTKNTTTTITTSAPAPAVAAVAVAVAAAKPASTSTVAATASTAKSGSNKGNKKDNNKGNNKGSNAGSAPIAVGASPGASQKPATKDATTTPGKSSKVSQASKIANASQAKPVPASQQPKGSPKEQWQFHFMKSRDDSTQGLAALLEGDPSLLMSKIGHGAAAQPGLFHAIRRGQLEKTRWLLDEMIWHGIAFDQDFAFALLDDVFQQATLVESGHQLAVKRFLLACENIVPNWDEAFITYLNERRAMIPPAYGFGPVAAPSVTIDKPQKRTRRETENWKEALIGANKLRHDLEAEVRHHSGKQSPAMPLTADDYQAYSASVASQLMRSGTVGNTQDLLLKPDGLGRIMLMTQIESRNWSMAKVHLEAGYIKEQLFATDNDYRTVLMMAVDQQHLPMVQQLLAAARAAGGKVLPHVLTAHDGSGFTPLVLACVNNHVETARELLGAGYVFEQLKYSHAGTTAFFFAKRHGSDIITNLLLEAADSVGLRDTVVNGIDDMVARYRTEGSQ